MRKIGFLLTFLFLACISFSQNSFGSFKNNYTKIERMITMRDGIKLFTAIYIPKDSSEKYPFLMVRTPYSCAPYGYYGPDWFTGGVFIGAGPWYHGHGGFYGHVDNRYDPRHGYAGPMPERGAQPFNHFQANEAHDPQGHVGNAGHEPTNEHSAGYQGGGHPGGGGEHSGGGHH